MSDTPPFDSFLKWKLGIESPSLAYAVRWNAARVASATSAADWPRFLAMYCVSTQRSSVTLRDYKSKEAFCCIVVGNFERWRLGHLFVRVQAGYWLNQLFPFVELPVLSLFLTYIHFLSHIAVYSTTNYTKGVTASFERLWRIFALKQKSKENLARIHFDKL